MARPWGQLLDRGIRSAGNALGASPRVMDYTRLLGEETAKDIAMNASIMGLFRGGIDAYGAEEGDKGRAFVRGLGTGALEGGAWGAVSGLTTQGIRNASRINLEGLAKKHNLSSAQIHAQQKEPGFFDNLKKTFKSRGLEGELARNRTMTGLGTFGSGWVLPGMVLPSALTGSGESEPTAPKVPTAPKAPPAQQPSLRPNTSFVYEQPQYYKAGSLKTHNSIDFTKMPSYDK